MTQQNEKKKILIVEDEKPLMMALHDKLTHEGFYVLQAGDGSEGLRLAFENHPDLILLDIIMPTMDGMTMLAKLRANEWGKNARIIVLTNLADEEKVEESMRQSVYDYLIKSDWTLEDLVKKVKAKLEV